MGASLIDDTSPQGRDMSRETAIRMRKRVLYKDSRPPELIRRLRRIRRVRNLLFLIIFLAMFGLGFNRVIAGEKGYFWLLLGIAGSVLAMFPLSSLALDMFNIYGTVRPFRGQDVVFFDLCAIVGIAVAIAIQYFWRPFGFIHVPIADYASGYFFITAVVLALLVYIVRGMAPIPVFRQTTKQIVLGILLWLFLYITLGQLLSFAWQRFTFTLPRLWRFALLFLLIWPLFLLDEGINRGYQEQGTIRAIAGSLAFKLLLIAGLYVAALITPGLDFLSTVLPILVLIFLLLVAFGTQIYASGRAAVTSATLSALVLAWCMSTALPIN
jgi:hypothetical protein